MTCNLINNESELTASFNSVSNSQTGNEWSIFGYDGTSSIIKLEAVGNGGLDQLLRSFNSSKIQYGFATVTANAGSQRKVILFHWQGEGVPAAKLSSTTTHVEEIRRFVRQVNLTINARNEEDLEKEVLERHFDKLLDLTILSNNNPPSEVKILESSSESSLIQYPINNNNTPFIPPTPKVVANQHSVLKQEINLNEREKFWDEMKDEEELRRKEEANKRRQIQAQYEYEQQQMTENLHKLHLEKMEAQKQQQFGKSNSFDSSSINTGGRMGKLISGRTQMFEKKVAELSQSEEKPLKKPKNFKWQVNLQNHLNSSQVVNQVPDPPPKQFECVLKKKEDNNKQTFAEIKNQLIQMSEQPKEPILNKIPVAPIPPVTRNPLNQQIGEQKQNNFEENKQNVLIPLLNQNENSNNISPPPSEPTITENEKQIINEQNNNNNNEKINLNGQQPFEIKAKALWDYQADDNTELTFNPDDIISEIEMKYDGWWYGRAPNGSVGLFPSNYVQLLQ